MGSLPWHPGDVAVTPDGVKLLVVIVRDGAPTDWHVLPDNPRGGTYPDDDASGSWPADAVPDLTDVGTAAAWLRSCTEVTRDNVPSNVIGIRQWNAVRDAIQSAAPRLVWHPDPALVARAVEATRAYLATLETR